PAENLTVIAKWKINQYTMSFDTQGGTEMLPVVQDYESDILVPNNPTKTGHTFIEWDTEIPEKMPAFNFTIKAIWEINQYTISFDTGGGSEVSDIVQDYESSVTAPNNPVKLGYTFYAWETAIPNKMPAENLIIKAKWKINQYTIIFDTKGGTAVAPIVQDYKSAVLPPESPTKTGFTFDGWEVPIPEIMLPINITIKAKWKINKYCINFDTKGGTEIEAITQDYKSSITPPHNPVKMGHAFAGWESEIPTLVPAEDITVVAKWKINQYKISFDTQGGLEIPDLVFDYDAEIGDIQEPIKEGYYFISWDNIIPNKMPVYDILLTANWEIIIPEIIGKANSQGTETYQVAEIDGKVKVILTAQPQNTYKFLYWKINGVVLSSSYVYSFEAKDEIQFEAVYQKIATPKVKSKILGGKKAKIYWESVPGNYQYKIYRKDLKSSVWKLVATTTKTSITQEKLAKGKQYSYYVVSTAKAGNIVTVGGKGYTKTGKIK
ncbi:MAG: InlB B-repeat-containing protein, partial [Anaerovoracaceae bacterium]